MVRGSGAFGITCAGLIPLATPRRRDAERDAADL